MVDSSAWIDYLNGQRAWQTNLAEHRLSDGPAIIGGLILAEVYPGARFDFASSGAGCESTGLQ